MQMASRKYYAYYLRGNEIAVIEQDYAYGDGQTLGQPSLDDIGPTGGYTWKSPITTVADGIEIEYTYSPSYFIKDTDSKDITYTTYEESDGLLKLTGTTDLSAILIADTYLVLKKAGKFNGLHRVKASNATTITTYTPYSGSSGTAITFEEVPDLYYDVNAINDEADELDIPPYLSKALVNYVKARLAEDRMDIEANQYFMREFHRMLEKHESGRVWGARIAGTGPHAIR